MTAPLCFMDNRDTCLGMHHTLVVRTNDFPIAPLHLLLVTAEHREALRAEDVRSVLDFAQAFPAYLLFHNMRGSGASRPEHVHFQAMLRDGNLPIATAPRRPLFTWDGATVARLEDYPVYGLTVQGTQAAETTLAMLRALAPTPYNLIVLHDEVIVVPRTVEQPAGFASKFAGLEMAGCVVLVDEERYADLTFEEIWQALSACGFSREQGAVFEHRLFAQRQLLLYAHC